MSTTEDQQREQGERDIEDALDRMEAEDRQAADDRRKVEMFDEMVAALRKLLVSLEPGAQADGHEFWHAKREATATLANVEASR